MFDQNRFASLKEAEQSLLRQGYKLIPDTCDWISMSGCISAGVYPVKNDTGEDQYTILYTDMF